MESSRQELSPPGLRDWSKQWAEIRLLPVNGNFQPALPSFSSPMPKIWYSLSRYKWDYIPCHCQTLKRPLTWEKAYPSLSPGQSPVGIRDMEEIWDEEESPPPVPVLHALPHCFSGKQRQQCYEMREMHSWGLWEGRLGSMSHFCHSHEDLGCLGQGTGEQ